MNNKGIVVTLSVILVAIVVASIVFLVIYFMGERDSGTKPFDYAPRETGFYVQYDSGANMDDVLKNYFPLIAGRIPGLEDQTESVIGEVIKQLPDLSFLKLAGFVTMPSVDEAEDIVIGFELSHRTNSKKSLGDLLKSLDEIGFSSKTDEAGFVNIVPPENGKGLYLFLEDDYLIVGFLRQAVSRAVETRNMKDGLSSLESWNEIEGSLSEVFGFYLNYKIDPTNDPEDLLGSTANKEASKILEKRFPNVQLSLKDWDNPNDIVDGEGIKIAGGLFSENGESGLKAKVIGSAKDMVAQLPTGVKESFEDLIIGQKDLDSELSLISGEHLLKVAISGALTGNRKLSDNSATRTTGFSKGTTNLWVDVDSQGNSTFAIKSIGTPQDVSSFITSNFPDEQYQSKKIGDHFEIFETMMGENGKLYVADKATIFYTNLNTVDLKSIIISNTLDGLNSMLTAKPNKEANITNQGKQSLKQKKSIISGVIGLDKFIQAFMGTSVGFEKLFEAIPPQSLRIKLVLFEESDSLYLKISLAMPF